MCDVFLHLKCGQKCPSKKWIGDNTSLPTQNPHLHTHTKFPPMHTHPLPSFLLPLQSVSLFLSPQSGLFTTTSSRLKLHSYSAPGMPAAMQQSKPSVILYHLHPWENGNEEGRRVEGKRRGRGAVRGGTETGGDRERKRETRI